MDPPGEDRLDPRRPRDLLVLALAVAALLAMAVIYVESSLRWADGVSVVIAAAVAAAVVAAYAVPVTTMRTRRLPAAAAILLIVCAVLLALIR